MSEDKKQTAILENVLGEVRQLNNNISQSEEGKTTGLAFGSAQISDDVQNLDENLNNSLDKVGGQLKDNAQTAQEANAETSSSEVEDKRDQMNIFKKMFTGISSLGTKFADFGKGIFEMGKEGGGKLFNTVLPLLLPALLSLLNSEQWKVIGEKVEQIKDALVSFYEGFLVPVFEVAVQAFLRQWEIFGELFSGIGDAIDLFKEGDILGGIKKLITTLGTFFIDTVDNLITGVYNLFAKFFGLEETDSVFGSITKFIKDTYENIKTTIKETYENVKAFFSEAVESVKTFFSDMGTNVMEGLSELSIFNFIKQTVTDIVDTVKKIFSGNFTKEDLLGGAFAFLDLVYAPLNLAINFIKDIFKFGDPEKPFKLSDFLFGPDGIFTRIVDFFKGLLDIDINKVVKSIPGAETVLKALGILEESDAEKKANIEAAIAEAEDRISRSEGGENVYFGRDRVGRDEDREEILELQKELNKLKSENQEEKQKASTLRVDPALQEAMKNQQATPVVAAASDNRQFRSSNNTYVTEFITDPVAQNRYANPAAT